jgi:hypothetical protein
MHLQREVAFIVQGIDGLNPKRRQEWLRMLSDKVRRLHPDEGYEAAIVNERDVRYWPCPGDIVADDASAMNPSTPCASSCASTGLNLSPSSVWSPSSELEDHRGVKRFRNEAV